MQDIPHSSGTCCISQKEEDLVETDKHYILVHYTNIVKIISNIHIAADCSKTLIIM